MQSEMRIWSELYHQFLVAARLYQISEYCQEWEEIPWAPEDVRNLLQAARMLSEADWAVSAAVLDSIKQQMEEEKP